MTTLHLLPPSTPPDLLRATASEADRRSALARLAWLLAENAPPELVQRWCEQRLVPLGVADPCRALERARQAPWWPALYAEWAAAMPDRRRLRLVRLVCYRDEEARGLPGAELIVESQRAMVQDCGIADPDAAATAARREPWWPALYAEEAARIAAV